MAEREEQTTTVAEDLVKMYRLAERFLPLFLYGDNACLREVHDLIQPETGPILFISPGRDMVARIQGALSTLQDDKRPVIWIGQGDFEKQTWRNTLVQLNMKRDWFAEKTNVMLILAGPEPLADLVMDHAPDLASFSKFRHVNQLQARRQSWPDLRVLHLADLHFQADVPWEERRELRRLMDCLAKQTQAGEQLDMVVMTGIAASGRTDDYQQALRFFQQLAETTGLDPAQSWFLCPGLGDLDFSEGRFTRPFLNPSDPDAAPSQLLDPGFLAYVGRRLEGFYAMTETLLGEQRAWDALRPWCVDVFLKNGVEIAVGQANTLWNHSGHDQTSVVVGAFQSEELALMASWTPFRLLVTWHPQSLWRPEHSGSWGHVFHGLGGSDHTGSRFALNTFHAGKRETSGFDVDRGAFFDHDGDLQPLIMAPMQGSQRIPLAWITKRLCYAMNHHYRKKMPSGSYTRISDDGSHIILTCQSQTICHDVFSFQIFHLIGGRLSGQPKRLPFWLEVKRDESRHIRSLATWLLDHLRNDLFMPYSREVVEKLLHEVPMLIMVDTTKMQDQSALVDLMIQVEAVIALYPKVQWVLGCAHAPGFVPPGFELMEPKQTPTEIGRLEKALGGQLRQVTWEELDDHGDVYALDEDLNFKAFKISNKHDLDLTLFSHMSTITRLELDSCQIKELTPLSGLKGLTQLNLDKNEIEELAPLSGLKGLTQLNLRGNKIQELTPLSGLKGLTQLNLGVNQIQELTPLSGLKGLTQLYLSYNEIKELTPLSGLKGLTQLDLSENQIEELRPLSGLKGLTQLNLGGNQIQELTPLSGLKGLTQLYLSYNEIEELTPLSGLKGLTQLYLVENQIEELRPLSGLKGLTQLYLSHNKIEELTPLSGLKGLTQLNLNRNKIQELTPLSGLKGLTQLNLNRNKIQELTPLSGLLRLTHLDLRGNQINHLPSFLLDLNLPFKLEGYDDNVIQLEDNPLIHPPPEVIRQGRDAIRAFFDAKGETRRLNEVKLVLIGDGGAGKTSLVNRLLGRPFDPYENVTDGIQITPWRFDYDGQSILVHIWDFGGQEILHATHQFFLSERCVYVVLLDARKDDPRTEYWLKTAQNLGKNSPVLLVPNKMDQNHAFRINAKPLHKRYPALVETFPCSCATGDGIDAIRQTLQTQLGASKLCRTDLPDAWFRVKAMLQKDHRPFLTQADYQQLCREEGIDSDIAIDTLVHVLHDLGVAVHFDDPRLNNTYVLDPRWVTRGVYALITADQIACKDGVLWLKDLPGILAAAKPKDVPPEEEHLYQYPQNTHFYLLDLMEKFELAYYLDRDRMLAPDLLPVEEPEFQTPEGPCRRYRLDHDFLPPSAMPRFIVKRHNDIQHQWRSGVVLKGTNSDTWTVVREDMENRRIDAAVYGERPLAYLTILRDTFAQIYKNAHTKITESIACVCESCSDMEEPHYFKVSLLLRMFSEPGASMLCENSLENVPLAALLDGAFEPRTIEDFKRMAQAVLKDAKDIALPEIPLGRYGVGVNPHDILKPRKR